MCSVVGGPDVSDGRAVFALQSERAQEHVKSGATRVVGANLGERLLGQFACCGLVPAEVGKVQQHARAQRAGRDLVPEWL